MGNGWCAGGNAGAGDAAGVYRLFVTAACGEGTRSGGEAAKPAQLVQVQIVLSDCSDKSFADAVSGVAQADSARCRAAVRWRCGSAAGGSVPRRAGDLRPWASVKQGQVPSYASSPAPGLKLQVQMLSDS